MPRAEVIDIIILVVIVLVGVSITIYKTRFDIKHKEVINESIEFLAKHRPARGKYTPKENIYRSFKDNYADFTNLTAMCRDIMRHLGLPNNSIAVYPVDELEGNAVGRYVFSNTGNYIEVLIRPDTRYTEVMAVLIHESMHYYLSSTGLGFNDVAENEILTDTATIYFGFGEFINRGYTRVGYIKYPEINYIKRKLKDSLSSKVSKFERKK